MRKKEILKAIVEYLNKDLQALVKYKRWKHAEKVLNLNENPGGSVNLKLVKQMVGKKVAHFLEGLSLNYRYPYLGMVIDEYLVDENGKGYKAVWEYKEVKVSSCIDEDGDYYVGFGRWKDAEMKCCTRTVEKWVVVDIVPVENVEVEDFTFHYLPEPTNQKNERPISYWIGLYKVVKKLPDDFDTEKLKIVVNPDDPEVDQMKLEIGFSDRFYYNLKLIVPDAWEGADYMDLDEELKTAEEVGEKAGQIAVKMLENGIVPDLKDVVQKAKKEIELEKNREQILQQITEKVDREELIKLREEILRERDERIKEIVLNQKLKKEIKTPKLKVDVEDTIDENNIDQILPYLISFPKSYLDQKVAEQILKLKAEYQKRFENLVLEKYAK